MTETYLGIYGKIVQIKGNNGTVTVTTYTPETTAKDERVEDKVRRNDDPSESYAGLTEAAQEEKQDKV